MVRTLYASAFLEDCILLYPVYALLFARTGLTGAEIASLFVLWSLTGFLLEIPSGVWADRFSRRRLLVLGPVLSGTGFALWTVLPSYGSFAAGFVLWGAGSALRSGTLEALVHEELAFLGTADRYARHMGRARACGAAGELVATAAAAPVLAVGGYTAVGAAGVLACAAGAAVAHTFPEHRTSAAAPKAEHTAAEPFGRLLRRGLAEARRVPAVRRAVLLTAVLTGALAYDEFLPLFAASTGIAVTTVPLLILLVTAAAAVGEWNAGRGRRLLRPALLVSAVLLVLAGLNGRPAAFGLVAVAYGIARWAATTAEARLQSRLSDGTRATVGSIAGVGSEVVAVLVFALHGLGSAWSPPGLLLACAALPYGCAACLLLRRRPSDGHVR
ncbi:MFS transporter [Streptomyces sp. TR06-5]|uniref:MFS transporter n=1 Tax=unclassified Streptomyces TaxID=2593676 RepID=UPI0039A0FC1D